VSAGDGRGGRGGGEGRRDRPDRQLISIARALLADPRILILDEATSTIDRPTERMVERALDRLLAGRTSLIIAHRLSTVRRAEEILVIDDGRIRERGNEAALLADGGRFAQLAGLDPGATTA
jgi:ATP-binding cassette subfamily B protein